MKRNWLSLNSVIAGSTSVTVIYAMSILLGAPLGVVLGLLLLAMVALVWMVIRILKDPDATNMTFDEYFYQDRTDIRRNGKE